MAKLQKFTCVDDVPNLEQALQECIDIKNNPLGTPDFGKNKTVGLVFLTQVFVHVSACRKHVRILV